MLNWCGMHIVLIGPNLFVMLRLESSPLPGGGRRVSLCCPADTRKSTARGVTRGVTSAVLSRRGYSQIEA